MAYAIAGEPAGLALPRSRLEPVEIVLAGQRINSSHR